MTSLRDIQLSNPRFRAKLEEHTRELEKSKRELEMIEERNNLRDTKLKRLERLIKNKIGEYNDIISKTIENIDSLTKPNYAEEVLTVLAIIQPIKNDTIPKLTDIHSFLTKNILKVRMAITDECKPKNDTVCSVCLGGYTNIETISITSTSSEAVDMPCTHIFHRCCIKQWFEKSGVCPMCNVEDARISYTSTIKPIFEEKIIELNAKLFEKFTVLKGVNDERIQSCLRIVFEGLNTLGAPQVCLEAEYTLQIPEDTLEIIIQSYRESGQTSETIIEYLVNYYHVPPYLATALVN